MSESPQPAENAHECDSGNFDRTICPEPCGAMHSYCDTCGRRADPCAHDHSEPAPWRKKPVVVEAVRFDRTNGGPVAKWCGGRNRFEEKASDPTDVAEWIDIPTLEGTMRASVGDYIIRGVQGEFYPCKPDIFLATYEHTRPGERT